MLMTQDILLAASVTVGPAVAISLLLRLLRPQMAPRRALLMSTLPAPVLILMLCTYVFVQATFIASDEQCGVDACGMAAMAAFALGGLAIAGWLASIAVVYLLQKVMRTR